MTRGRIQSIVRTTFAATLALAWTLIGIAQTPVTETAAELERLGPQIGQRVPDFSLADQSGATRTLKSVIGPKGAMIVFFPAAAATSVETKHLSLTTVSSDAVAAPGTRIALRIDVTPKPKMHVYAPEQKDYISISLALEPDESFKARAPVFPKAEKYFFEPLKETQLVFSKPFRIVQEVTLALTPAFRERARTEGATLTIKGTLRYQACDDRVCYLPQNVPVSWTIGLRPLER